MVVELPFPEMHHALLVPAAAEVRAEAQAVAAAAVGVGVVAAVRYAGAGVAEAACAYEPAGGVAVEEAAAMDAGELVGFGGNSAERRTGGAHPCRGVSTGEAERVGGTGIEDAAEVVGRATCQTGLGVRIWRAVGYRQSRSLREVGAAAHLAG